MNVISAMYSTFHVPRLLDLCSRLRKNNPARNYFHIDLNPIGYCRQTVCQHLKWAPALAAAAAVAYFPSHLSILRLHRYLTIYNTNDARF